jgi:hypothetical protein
MAPDPYRRRKRQHERDATRLGWTIVATIAVVGTFAILISLAWNDGDSIDRDYSGPAASASE